LCFGATTRVGFGANALFVFIVGVELRGVLR
jgi:hypothetical protein